MQTATFVIMTRSFILLLLVATTLPLCAQELAKAGATITFEKKSHDFGDIAQGDKVEHTFKFTNTGTEPLVITNVQVTCGCTTPKGWPRDPIMPGNSGEITVGFTSSGKPGRHHKPIKIVSNAVNKEGSQVSITVNVLPRDSQ